MAPGQPAAFFDLDSTLLAVNSGALWIRRELRVGRITRRQYVEALVYLAGYKLSVIDMDRVMGKALETIAGLDEDTVRGWTERWYRDEVACRAAPGAWEVLDRHRTAGHPLVLLTSSSPYESAMAADQFGLDAFLCTRYEVVDGRFTGRPLQPLCFGRGKVAHAERFAAEHGIDLAASWFYTDSLTDLPMLERVGHPVAVDPDPRLRRVAVARGWPVVSWRPPRRTGPAPLIAPLRRGLARFRRA
ncbi:MAG: HAD family hydrolase [Deltaproteobacteria bacterium]|nr:MAG: HAD family hydrolase [Deltaproteobacteria bacterium]